MGATQSKVISNAAVAILGTAVSSALAVVYVSLGARWLGPADYATVGAITSLANMMALTLNAFETGIALRAAAISGQHGPAALQAFCARSLRAVSSFAVAGIALWLLATPFIAPRVDHDPASFAWLGVLFFASVVLCIPRGVLRANEMFPGFAMNLAIESAIRVALGLLLVKSIGGAASMVAGYALATVASVLLGLWQTRAFFLSRLSTKSDAGHLRDLLTAMAVVSGPLLGLDLYSALMVNGDVVAAEYYLGAHEAGLYAGAAQVARMVLIGATPIVTVLVSRLAVLSAQREDTAATLWQGTALVLGALLASFVVPLFAGSFVLRLLLGDAYVAAEPVLRLQWATACVLTLQYFFVLAALSTSAPRAGWLFLLPACVLALGLHVHHGSGSAIAWTALLCCSIVGSPVCLALWYWRRTPSVASLSHRLEKGADSLG